MASIIRKPQAGELSPPSGNTADPRESSSSDDQDLRKSRNPRRPLAHQSVSLMQAPPRNALYSVPRGALFVQHKGPSTLAPSTVAEPPSTVSSKPACQKDSSGESSNADTWFEKSNNKVRPSPALLTENDPPFLLRNSSSSDSPEDGVGRPITSHHTSSYVLQRPGLPFLPTLASSSEDFRGVIDDLTIENKKLKRKLKKYEKLQDSHLQDEKLFEVRVHSLSAEKKRELEAMLKKFVMSCEDTPADQRSSTHGLERGGARLPTGKTNDSAYGSMSMSGQVSSAQSGQRGQSSSGRSSSHRSRHQPIPNVPHQHISHQQQQNIQSYLHDIPSGLMPRDPVAMTEKAKRKLVVRRLEQIFAGKASNSGGHSQPLQQQEVSQLAARADRKEFEAIGQRFPEEGAREAYIMKDAKGEQQNPSRAMDINMDTATSASAEGTVEEHDFARAKPSESAQQRPTRPLDLDPYRAQVAADNIQYFRHLGFSPLDPGSMQAPEEGHGWIYLNVLINMAQLHTLNVTTDFVQKAVADVSGKLELSGDGRKVRWRGGTDVTRTSTDSSPDDDHRSGQSQRKNEIRKGSKLVTAISSSTDESMDNVLKAYKSPSRDRLAYTPLFFHKQDDEDSQDGNDDNESSYSSPQHRTAGDSSGFTSSGMRTSNPRRKRGDGGPIIFYNQVNFCTDLSGDARGKELSLVNSSGYSKLATEPIGAASTGFYESIAEPRGPLSMPHALPSDDSMDIDKSSTASFAMDIDMPTTTPLSTGSTTSEASSNLPFDLEASGIGGVLPEDNFSIRIKAQRKLDQADTPQQQLRAKLIPPTMRDLLQQRGSTLATAAGGRLGGKAAMTKRQIVQETISERRRNLPPADLPPASYLPFESALSDSEDESTDSEDTDMSDEEIDTTLPTDIPQAAPQMFNWPTLSSDAESSDEDDEDDDNDDYDDSDNDNVEDNDDGASSGSVDLLAYAREVDPATIRAQEREYDSQLAERLAEEIPAGSSAATAGGGSGFNSPVNAKEAEAAAVAAQQHQLRKGPAGAGPSSSAKGLKRARTSEGVASGDGVVDARIRKSPRLSERH